MTKYLLKRTAWFFFTLIFISLIAFAVTVSAPGDPAERLVNLNGGPERLLPGASSAGQLQAVRHRLGLDLPLFYFTLQSAAAPDTLQAVFPAADRRMLERMLRRHGDWEKISRYYRGILSLQATVRTNASGTMLPDEGDLSAAGTVQSALSSLRTTTHEEQVQKHLNDILSTLKTAPSLQSLLPATGALRQQYGDLVQSGSSWRNYVPVVRFHAQNQYGRWLFGDGRSRGIVRGDFGISYTSGQPVSEYIADRLPWTIFFACLSVALAYLFGIPLALRMARRPGGRFDRRVTSVLYLLYSLPGFWLATILLMTFANPDVLHLFPASGVQPAGGFPPGSGFFQKVWLTLPYLVLPTACYTYAFLAVLTRLLRVSLDTEMRQDYVRTARAKGLDDATILRRHALPNALLPAITLLAHLFPMALGGSVILESIFTIPGMGYGIYQSIQSLDIPVLVSFFTLSGLLTMTGYFVTDMIYAWVDPRIRYQ